MRNDELTCGRENDLIGFLYGELNEVEAIAFQRHLNACATCSAELLDFGEVRESVVAWRNESLGSVALPAQATTANETPRATRSALTPAVSRLQSPPARPRSPALATALS